MSITLDAALRYVDRGWPVFPVNPKTNTPLIASAHPEGDPLRGVCKGECGRDGHGFHDATLDPDKVNRWWSRWTHAAIGVPTGIAFDVLDVDHTDFVEGVADLPDCETDGGPVARSGGGKWHLYFTPSGLGRSIRFAKWCDWLGTDGYVIVPPSGHKSGGTYSWYGDTEHLELHPAPPELVAFVGRDRVTEQPPSRQLSTRRSTTPTRSGSWSPTGLIARMATAAEGERNIMLNWCAGRVGDDVRAGKCSEADGLAALDEIALVAERIGLTAREVDATIASGYSAGRNGRVA
jgi:hypothetical protein